MTVNLNDHSFTWIAVYWCKYTNEFEVISAVIQNYMNCKRYPYFKILKIIEVEIADLESSIEAEDVEDAVRGFFEQEPEIEFRVSLTKIRHIAAECRGPDRSKRCWRCRVKWYTAGFCTRQPRCYLCTASGVPIYATLHNLKMEYHIGKLGVNFSPIFESDTIATVHEQILFWLTLIF